MDLLKAVMNKELTLNSTPKLTCLILSLLYEIMYYSVLGWFFIITLDLVRNTVDYKYLMIEKDFLFSFLYKTDNNSSLIVNKVFSCRKKQDVEKRYSSFIFIT